ncbi:MULTISPECIES: PD-(D/E)XK nuclease-like domain-containing protein [Streptomyces]|uniref:PD-(D/E)XK nuclease-like domain-containing protein n=1 Tax=Streptomyces griseosporeus TaxID=1910 RepID=A0ABV3KU81_STRGS|nr:PD-(D/E)XK nuclease-like domain-containing protein [Streptomyces actuosus]MBM4819821.1 PD-(D/E)XK nuclease-like domain-containing protein [Streptomyces actuosus]
MSPLACRQCGNTDGPFTRDGICEDCEDGKPGWVDGLPAEDYHADRTTISSTGLRALLPPGCPAQFHYDREHPAAPKREFDLGNAVHAELLGEGAVLAPLDFDSYQTKAAQEARDEARADGRVPLLAKEWEQVQAMVAAVRSHPIAGPLFAPGMGVAERSMYWTDPATGVRCRIRPDWLRNRETGGRLIVVDVKTARAVDPAALQRAVYEHGYHAQAAFYLAGVKALGLHGDQEPAFVFAFQSKTPPYLVHLVELDFPALTLGAARNERALRIYAECQRTGVWPGFNDQITYLPLPPYAEKRDNEEYL